ncbi:hypothetical protein GOODEAATRI_002236 [Goodea atripinnis]|uniref:Obg domain-containing protein n=1 Tax=Goodea atripinnis TaxID=208336 RepID=A0ABV0NJ94_9TELE
MALPRLGGHGGNGGDVWVVATKNMTLKKVKDKYPLKRFLGGPGGNSRHVIPVSASTGFGVDHLKNCIRLSLDEYAAMETSSVHQEKLQALRQQSCERL